MNFRKVLGISYDADERVIKRAYSALIKQYRPDTHPAEFAEVREAYEAAMQDWQRRRRWEEEEQEEELEFANAEPVAERAAENHSFQPHARSAAEAEGPFDREFERVLSEPPAYSDAPPLPEMREPQEFERVLTEPPVLAYGGGNPPDGPRREFERVITEPPALAPPDMPTMATGAMGDARTLAAMLVEFEEHAGKASEDEQLERYRAHARRLADWPLDMQMDYEQGLLSWLLSSENPSLLVFQEADQRFHWESYSMAIVRTYGDWGGQRYAGLKQLAKLFAAARAARNPFLLLEGKVYRRFPVDDHYSELRAQEQSAAWQLACERAGVTELAPRLAYADNHNWRIYWADVMVGAIAAWVEWLLLLVEPTPLMWLRILLVGVAALPVVVAVHGIALWVSAKLRPITSRVNAWRKAWPRLAGAAGWAAFVAVMMTNLFIMPVVDDMPALMIVPGLIGATMLTFMVWVLYRTLARIEVALTYQVLRLMRFAAWLRRVLAPA